MKVALVSITTILLLSCASNLHKPVDYTLNLKDYHEYRYAPCSKELVKKAHDRLLKAEGCSECALYFLRCSDPSALKKELRAIKARRRYKE